MRNGRETFDWALDFHGFSMFGVLRDVFGENKSLLEVAINLAQFPED
jgi:hypothetical protein